MPVGLIDHVGTRSAALDGLPEVPLSLGACNERGVILGLAMIPCLQLGFCFLLWWLESEGGEGFARLVELWRGSL